MKFHVESLNKKQFSVLHKLLPIVQQKDFCDIYALGIKQFSLEEMLALYRKKFSVQDISPVLYGLAYFDDEESERMPKMLWEVKWVDIQKEIQSWVKTSS